MLLDGELRPRGVKSSYPRDRPSKRIETFLGDGRDDFAADPCRALWLLHNEGRPGLFDGGDDRLPVRWEQCSEIDDLDRTLGRGPGRDGHHPAVGDEGEL